MVNFHNMLSLWSCSVKQARCTIFKQFHISGQEKSAAASTCSHSFKLPSFPHCKREGNNNITPRTQLHSLRKGFHIVKCGKNYVTADEPLKRSDFEKDFLFGAGTSAVQTEGAYKEDEKGLSVYDHYTHERKSANVDIAIDSYHRYREDIMLVKAMGMTTYRFSISWPRILPEGSLEAGREINMKGVEHYKNFIKELLRNGITPFVTLFHFDMPQALEEKYDGMLNRKFVDDFTAYCDICFCEFGDLVKHWCLINEPNMLAKFGYEHGAHPPGRTSNGALEPYIATHNLLLAHASAYRLYKRKYEHQQGEIGISLSTPWQEPHTGSPEDKEATERIRDFGLGWYLGPLLEGDYPERMKSLVKDRLPVFYDNEKEMLKNSIDFLGVNYYTANYVRSLPIPTNAPPVSCSKDSFAETLTENKDGIPIGPLAKGSLFIRNYPDGLRKLLVCLNEIYHVKKIIVTENGVSNPVSESPNIETAYNDQFRAKFIKDHLVAIRQAIAEGVNVKGYYYWSLLDSFEFFDGYNQRYGLNFTDFKTLDRSPKYSAKWFKEFLSGSTK